jgi:hypothetical protein
MMTLATSVSSPKTLYQVAAELYHAHGGDEEKTRNALRARINHDIALADQALAYVVDMLIANQISHERSDKLRAMAMEPRPDRALTDVGLEARGRFSLMTYKLPETMKLLGEATKAEIYAAYEHHRTSRVSHGLRERWFYSIWEALADVKTPVKRQLKESDLRKLEIRARKAEAEAR